MLSRLKFQISLQSIDVDFKFMLLHCICKTKLQNIIHAAACNYIVERENYSQNIWIKLATQLASLCNFEMHLLLLPAYLKLNLNTCLDQLKFNDYFNNFVIMLNF